MTARAAIRASLAVLAILAAGGCSRGGEGWTLQEFVTSRTGPPKEMGWVDDPDPDKRREAIEVLSSQRRYRQEPHTKFYALALTNDPDALVRGAAARALGLAGDPTYLPPLVAALEDASAVVRCDAAWALDRMADASAVEPLRKHTTQDPSPDVRAACCRALGHYALSEVGPTLLRALGDADLNVRRVAQATLSNLTGVDAGDQAEDWSLYVQQKIEAAQ